LFGSADAWERDADATPVLASPSGVNPDFDAEDDETQNNDDVGDVVERRRGESGSSASSSSDSNSRPSEKISLPSRPYEDDAGVVEIGGGDGWVGDGLTGWVASARPPNTANSASVAAAASAAAERNRPTERASPTPFGGFKDSKSAVSSNGKDSRDPVAADGPGSWYPGSSGSSQKGAASSGAFMPKWKAQTPIEVFEDNDVSVDARSGAERLGNKHRYHVGDSSRRKSIDKAGFRDDTAIESGKNSSDSSLRNGKFGGPFGGLAGGLGGSVPFPSPLGLASVPGSPEKVGGGGLGFSIHPLMRQSSADSADLVRDLTAPPPSPFATRRDRDKTNGFSTVGTVGPGSPPRSPTRARTENPFRGETLDEHPSRPSSPAFGRDREENPDSVRTWGASEGRRMNNGGPVTVPTRPVPQKAPSRLLRSQSMGAFADDAFDEAFSDVKTSPKSDANGANGDVNGKAPNKTKARRGSVAAVNGRADAYNGAETRPAIWEVFGGDRDKGAKK
jgi:hypothetical protein